MSSSDAVPVGMEETLDVSGGFPRLSEDQIGILSHHGERRPTEVGQVLFREGETIRALYVILSGKVGVVEGFGAEERVLSVHGPRRFLGELDEGRSAREAGGCAPRSRAGRPSRARTSIR